MRCRGIVIVGLLLATALACEGAEDKPAAPEAAPSPAAQPPARWVPLRGGEDLMREASWVCTQQAEAINGQVAIAAEESSRSPLSQWPSLEVLGDFGVTATIEVATTDPAGISLHGTAVGLVPGEAPPLKRLDFGIGSGEVRVAIHGGAWAPGQVRTTARNFRVGVLTDKVEIGIRRIGSEFVVLVRGAEVGRLADPGLFADGKVYIGTTVAAKNRLTIHSLSTETLEGQEGNVRVVRWPPVVPQILQGESLRSLGQARNILIGTSGSGTFPVLNDSKYRETLGREFSLVNTNVEFAQVHPRRDLYNFCQQELRLAFAKANNMQVYAQPIFFAQDLPVAPLPDWLIKGQFTPEELRPIFREHVSTLVGRYKGQVRYWTVVNEPMAVAFYRRQSFLASALGPDYIEQALRWAHEADPQAQLCINESNAEGLEPKSDALYRLAQDLVRRGAPLHCVGLEMHVSIDPVEGKNAGLRFPQPPKPQDLAANMRRLAELGLEVLITEMDVSVGNEVTQEKLAEQGRVYRKVMEVCLAEPNCKAFMTFGVNDRYSWIRTSSQVNRPWEAPLLFDDNYRPKPAYHSLREALRAR